MSESTDQSNEGNPYTMPQMKIGKDYYTAKQVKEKLGITANQLYSYVRNGTLQHITPPGKKQGVYIRKEVDQLAEDLNAFLAIRKKEVSKFGRATEADIPEILEISRSLFGDSIIAAETRVQWLRKNADTFFILKNEDLIVGYASILPLKQEIIDKLVREEIGGEEITANDVEEFLPDTPTHIYIMAIGVDPQYSIYEKHQYGARLISGLFSLIRDLGQRRVIIETITARSHKPDGIRLLRKLGFPQIQSPIPGKRLFIANVDESGIPILEQYKQILHRSQKRT